MFVLQIPQENSSVTMLMLILLILTKGRIWHALSQGGEARGGNQTQEK